MVLSATLSFSSFSIAVNANAEAGQTIAATRPSEPGSASARKAATPTQADRLRLFRLYLEHVWLTPLCAEYGVDPAGDAPLARLLRGVAAHRAYESADPINKVDGLPTGRQTRSAARSVIRDAERRTDPRLTALEFWVECWFGDSRSRERMLEAGLEDWLASDRLTPAQRAFVLFQVLRINKLEEADQDRVKRVLIDAIVSGLTDPDSGVRQGVWDDRLPRWMLIEEMINEDGPIGIDGQRAVANGAAAEPDADPWLSAMIRGQHGLDQAWEERGSGFSSTVSERGWRQFERWCRKADTAFAEAERLGPHFPDAAATRIALAMAGHSEPDNERTLFERAISLQIDHWRAWDRLEWALRPRWGGSIADMRALAVEAVETGRFETALPVRGARILLEVFDERDDSDGQHDPADQRAVARMRAAGQAAGVDDPDWLATMAGLSYAVGHYAEAEAALEAALALGRPGRDAVDRAERAHDLPEPPELLDELRFHQSSWGTDWDKVMRSWSYTPWNATRDARALLEKHRAAGPEAADGDAIFAWRRLFRWEVAERLTGPAGRDGWSPPIDLMSFPPETFKIWAGTPYQVSRDQWTLRPSGRMTGGHAVLLRMFRNLGGTNKVEYNWLKHTAIDVTLDIARVGSKGLVRPTAQEIDAFGTMPALTFISWSQRWNGSDYNRSRFIGLRDQRAEMRKDEYGGWSDGRLLQSAELPEPLTFPLRLRCERHGTAFRLWVNGQRVAEELTYNDRTGNGVGLALMSMRRKHMLIIRDFELRMQPFAAR